MDEVTTSPCSLPKRPYIRAHNVNPSQLKFHNFIRHSQCQATKVLQDRSYCSLSRLIKSTVEHNVNFSQVTKRSSRRPDLSTFHATFNETYGDNEALHNPNNLPTPENVVATYRLAADAFEIILNDHGGENQVLTDMIGLLEGAANAPPSKLEGVSDAFISELDRVPKSKLKKDDCCPICSEPFLDGKCQDLSEWLITSLYELFCQGSMIKRYSILILWV